MLGVRSSQHTPHGHTKADESWGIQPQHAHHVVGRGRRKPWLHKADHSETTPPQGLGEGLGLAAAGGSGVHLHALLQLPQSLDKLLRFPVGAALQHPQRGLHCGQGGGDSIRPCRPLNLLPLDLHSPWARGLRRCRVMGCSALVLPPTWDRKMPPMLPRLRAASPAKSLVDNQSWSMTVNSTQAPRRRHASAGTELQADDSHLEPCSLLRQTEGG